MSKKRMTLPLYLLFGSLTVRYPFICCKSRYEVNTIFPYLVYHLQQEAPTAVAVLNSSSDLDESRPPYFKNEYHGSISNQKTNLLLEEDGQYLVRESGKSRKHHTLSLRFNNEFKHYRLEIQPSNNFN